MQVCRGGVPRLVPWRTTGSDDVKGLGTRERFNSTSALGFCVADTFSCCCCSLTTSCCRIFFLAFSRVSSPSSSKLLIRAASRILTTMIESNHYPEFCTHSDQSLSQDCFLIYSPIISEASFAFFSSWSLFFLLMYYSTRVPLLLTFCWVLQLSLSAYHSDLANLSLPAKLLFLAEFISVYAQSLQGITLSGTSPLFAFN